MNTTAQTYRDHSDPQQQPGGPHLVDVKTACSLLSVKRTKLFALLKQDGGLRRIGIGKRKTLVTMESIGALIEKGGL